MILLSASGSGVIGIVMDMKWLRPKGDMELSMGRGARLWRRRPGAVFLTRDTLTRRLTTAPLPERILKGLH
jgi:hypothetical protein